MAIGKVQIDLEARLAKFESDIGRAARVLEREMARGAQASERRMRQMERQISSGMQRIERSANRAGAAVVSFFSIRAIAGLASQLTNVADEFSNVQAKVRLAAGENTVLAQSIDQVYGVAQRTYNTLDGTASLVQRGAMALRNFGQEAGEAFDNSIRLAELFNKTLVISGASSSEAAAAALQFSQALASGRFQGDEFRSVLENNSRFAQLLADSLGVNIAELRDLSKEGKLTTTTFLDLLNRTGEVNAEFERMPVTVGRAKTQLDNAFTMFIGQADQALGLSRGLASAMSALATNIGPVATAIANVGVVIAGAFAGRGIQSLRAWTAGILEQARASKIAEQATRERAAADAAAAQQALLKARNDQIGVEASAAAAAADRARIQAAIQLANSQIAAIRASALRATSEIEMALLSERLTAAENARAAATVALGAARQAEVAANAQLIISNRALAAAYVATGAAGQAAATKVTLGMRAATIAQNAMTLATRAFSGALALVGGPLGAVIIGVGLLASGFANAKVKADQAATSFQNAIETANNFLDNQSRASALAAGSQLLAEREVARERLKLLQDQRNVPRPLHFIDGNRVVTNAGLDEEIRKQQANLDALNQKLQNVNAQIMRNHESWDQAAKSTGAAAESVDDQNKKLEEQRQKLELQRIELTKGLRARLEFEAMQQQGVKTADDLNAATREKIDAIVKEQSAIDGAKKAEQDRGRATRSLAGDTRRAESASRQFANALTELQLSIEGPLLQAQREYNADLAKFEDLAKRGKISADSLAEAKAALDRRRAMTTDDMQAAVLGPQAEAQLEFNRRLRDYQDIARATNLTEEQLADAETRLRREFDLTTREIERRQDPAAALLDDMKFELELMRMTNAERATAIQLRQLEGQATDDQIESIRRTNQAIEDQARVIEGMDAVRESGQGLIKDLLRGTKGWKDAFLDALDRINDRFADMIAEQWMDKLLGQKGSSGDGASGGWFEGIMNGIFGGSQQAPQASGGQTSDGGGWWQAIGSVVSSWFGGARANGGPVSAGKVYRVQEREEEFFQPASNGRIIPLSQLLASGGSSEQRPQRSVTVEQNFYNPIIADRRSDTQRQLDAARKLRLSGRNA